MNAAELRLALRPMPFLRAHARSPDGVLELRRTPPRLLVWHPDGLARLFRADARLRHPGSRSLLPLFGERSLLWADGERHLAYRRLLTKALLGPAVLGYRDIIAQEATRALDELAPGTAIALTAWCRRLALRVIARVVLGDADESLLAEFGSWLDRALSSPLRSLSYQRLRGELPRSGPEFDRRLVEQADLAGPSLAARLLAAGPGPRDGSDLRDQLVSLLFAGHETTAAAMAWTLFRIHRSPRLEHELRAELATGADGTDETGVPLLQATILESMRLTPPVTIAEKRALPADTELLDRPLPAGTVLTPSIYLAHRHPDVFPRAETFDPERFLSRTPTGFIPFGGGSRRCPGSKLALLEARMVIAAMLQRRDWGCPNPGAGRSHVRGHVLVPGERLRLVVRRRRGGGA